MNNKGQLNIASIQMVSSSSVETNLDVAEELVAKAKAAAHYNNCYLLQCCLLDRILLPRSIILLVRDNICHAGTSVIGEHMTHKENTVVMRGVL